MRVFRRLEGRSSFALALILILVLAAVLRLYQLAVYPQRFNQDELAMGYDSWSIWQTGRDQHGDFFPISFRGFNDYVNLITNYLFVIPTVGLFGLSQTTTRLPFALMGIATVGLVGLLGRRWFSPGAGLLAAFLLAIAPWHISFSRIAFGASSVPFFISLSIYSFTRALDRLASEGATTTPARRGFVWLALSSLSFALLTATYAPMKLQGPILVAVCALAAAPFLWHRKRVALIWLGLYAVLISPVYIDQLMHWQLYQARFNGISVLGEENWPLLFLSQWASHFNPEALLFAGYNGKIVVHPAFIGLFFWLEGPLWIAGIAALSRPDARRRPDYPYRVALLIGLGLLLAPMASSLTTENIPHETRPYNVLPFPELLAGCGGAYVWRCLRALRRRWPAYAVAAGSAVVVVAAAALFLPFFFNPPLDRVPNQEGRDIYFNIGLGPVVERIEQLAGPCDVVWMQRAHQAYIYYLFFSKYPPAQFQAVHVDRNDGFWLYIPWFANVRFSAPGLMNAPLPDSCAGVPSDIYYIVHGPRLPGWEDVIVTQGDNGLVLWRGQVQRALR